MSSIINIFLDIIRLDAYPRDMKKKGPAVQVQTYTVTRRVTLEDKTCAQCGQHCQGRKNRQYCSLACAKKASYWRHPDAYRAARMKSYRKLKGQKQD